MFLYFFFVFFDMKEDISDTIKILYREFKGNEPELGIILETSAKLGIKELKKTCTILMDYYKNELSKQNINLRQHIYKNQLFLKHLMESVLKKSVEYDLSRLDTQY